VDFDPDGIAIMSTYKHGSWTLSHENANLNVPSMRWLGLQSRELLDGTTGGMNDGLLQLTMRDRKKAIKMLERPLLDGDGEEKEWRRELQVMLMLAVKAEMEVLADRAGGVCGWVEKRLLEEIGTADDIMDI
jgi:meiotic recombination protein SPO11